MKAEFSNFFIIYGEPLQESKCAISDGWDIIRIQKIEDLKKFIETFEEIKKKLIENGEYNN